jgi:HD-like signal output (HDOD) protein
MTSSVPPPNSAARPNSLLEDIQRDRRKTRLMAVLSQGLPTLPAYVLDLNVLLGQPAVDLKKVGNVIRTDPSLTSQVLRLCNSALFGLRRRVMSIEQAAILLGTARLRTLVLTCSVMQFAGMRLPRVRLDAFWHHSFLCALLSERLATQLHYCEKEQAYLGGLLHDIGQLPMWILVSGEDLARRALPPPEWSDNLIFEREYFAMDHCKVGRWMGISWKFMPSFIDVFEFHHAPELAQHDPYLVGIIAAADQFLIAQQASQLQSPALLSEPLQTATPQDTMPQNKDARVPEANSNPEIADSPRPLEETVLPVLGKCLPDLGDSELHSVMELLRTEYLHLLPLVQLGMTFTAGDAA